MVQQTASAVLGEMCARYSGAVNASDAGSYSQLFATDAIWMPPGAPSRRGPAEIKAAEEADYETERLAVSFTPGDALSIGDDWVYGIAHVDGTGTGLGINAGKTRFFKLPSHGCCTDNQMGHGKSNDRCGIINHRKGSDVHRTEGQKRPADGPHCAEAGTGHKATIAAARDARQETRSLPFTRPVERARTHRATTCTGA